MTSKEFKEARYRLGLTQKQLGNLIDTNPRTVRKWEDGERSPNPVACQVMRWMLAGFRPPEFPGQANR